MPFFRLSLICALLTAIPAAAVEPDEILPEPALEERARAISKELRCLVCQNESIDDSNAPLAEDLRLLVRELLVSGLTDDEVFEHVTGRYGEFVLLRPRASGSNLILYLAGPAFLLTALGVAAVYVRRRGRGRPSERQELSEAEKRKIQELTG
ncbi:MAG: cytochrome c-type biogenesis protein CcmH [Rhodobacteraceae bacterium]|nr:cytochrome c-type biogenesis protein CcmH [Paracoccaceae bacterium]